MTSPVPPPDGDVFTVPYDADRGSRRSTLATGLATTSAVLASVLGVAITAAMWWIATQDGSSVGTLVTAVVITVAMAGIVWYSWRPVLAASRNRRNLEHVRDALQISAEGVGFPDLERGTWIVVPWTMIISARVMTWRTLRFVHLELSPELSATTPGAKGLDDPTTLRSLMRRSMGMVGPRFALGVPQRSPEEIDAALRHHSGGRIFLT